MTPRRHSGLDRINRGALTTPEIRSALEDAGVSDLEFRDTHRVYEHTAAAIIRAREPAADGSPASDRSIPPGSVGGSSSAGASAASEESPDGGHHLFGPLVLLAGFGADHAGVRVPVEQSERDLV